MRSLLEKSIIHLLNGEQEKAEALFHKFMVERARKIHESLRQDEDVDLNQGWNAEITEEEYFDNDDLEGGDEFDDEAGDAGDVMDDAEADDLADVPDADAEPEVGDDLGDDLGDDVDDDDLEAGAAGGDMAELAAKVDSIDDKMDQLMAEFERQMGSEDDLDTDVDDLDTDVDDVDADVDDLDTDVDDVDADVGDEPAIADDDDLADRMQDDMSTDDDEPEEETMESAELGDDEELDEELAEITESVLSELEKIASPGNTDGKEIGTGGSVKGNRESPLPRHSVEDRVKGAKPYLVKGGNNDSFARETPPSSKGVDTVVKGVRNSRKSYSDGMDRKSKEGDSAAALNSDYAAKRDTKSPLGGNKSEPTGKLK